MNVFYTRFLYDFPHAFSLCVLSMCFLYACFRWRSLARRILSRSAVQVRCVGANFCAPKEVPVRTFEAFCARKSSGGTAPFFIHTISRGLAYLRSTISAQGSRDRAMGRALRGRVRCPYFHIAPRARWLARQSAEWRGTLIFRAVE